MGRKWVADDLEEPNVTQRESQVGRIEDKVGASEEGSHVTQRLPATPVGGLAADLSRWRSVVREG